jgi:immune inhibitor A
VLVAVLAVVLTAAVASAAPPEGKGNGNGPKLGKDDLKHPLGEKQSKLKEKAVAAKLAGKVPASAKVVKLGKGAKGQYVELAREGEDSIFTILGQFGPDAATHNHGSLGVITHSGPAGPLHNEIPQPDRSVDNSTIWAPDFNKAHYEEMLFSEAFEPSMRNLYIELSSNRYTVNGDVSDWVQVPFNAPSYGSNYCGSNVCADTWRFVNDSADAWYAQALASLGSAAAVDQYLSQFDVWDRYDSDGDGNFDESDGYIDHFQSVHAGMGEEVGGGAQGEDAIWSHRWYAWFAANGPDGTGPSNLGGLKIGNSNYWIGDYTVEPENGGVGVFAHEFAHDLGLPDLYDGAGENSTGWWTLMSQGSYGGDGGPDGIGTMGMQMGAWEKLVLGWLNYEFVPSVSKKTEHKLGPSNFNTKQAQALIVGLPTSANQTVITLADPPEGNFAWWSGMGDNLDNTMSRDVAAGTTLTAKLWYDIEENWDYFYAEASSDGTTWTSLPGNLTTNTNPNGQNFGNGITGSSGPDFVGASWTVPAGTTHIRFRYWTDGFVQGKGVLIDEIATGSFSDGAESSPNGWTLNGFSQSTGGESRTDPHYYIAEFRQYGGFDEQLATAPYNFGFLDNPALQNWVEHFPYQDGLMINYWDTYYGDNSTAAHPGQGLILPIDAHPAPLVRADGVNWRCRVQAYDSTFGLEPTDQITLHRDSAASVHGPLPAVSVFNDNQTFYSAATPTCGVNHPHTGTQIAVQSVTPNGFMQVQVAPVK